MMSNVTSDEQLELLESAVALRIQGREVPERVRRTLAAVEARLIDVIGPLVRKRVAARLLGVSVQALDRWVAKGELPTEPIAEGSGRKAVRTDALLDVAYELSLLRQRGEGTVGTAIAARRVRWEREAEIRDADQLNVDLHLIAQAFRRRSA